MKNILKLLIISLIFLITYSIYALIKNIYNFEPPVQTTVQSPGSAVHETAKLNGADGKTKDMLTFKESAGTAVKTETGTTPERTEAEPVKTVNQPPGGETEPVPKEGPGIIAEMPSAEFVEKSESNKGVEQTGRQSKEDETAEAERDAVVVEEPAEVSASEETGITAEGVYTYVEPVPEKAEAPDIEDAEKDSEMKEDVVVVVPERPLEMDEGEVETEPAVEERGTAPEEPETAQKEEDAMVAEEPAEVSTAAAEVEAPLDSSGMITGEVPVETAEGSGQIIPAEEETGIKMKGVSTYPEPAPEEAEVPSIEYAEEESAVKEEAVVPGPGPDTGEGEVKPEPAVDERVTPAGEHETAEAEGDAVEEGEPAEATPSATEKEAPVKTDEVPAGVVLMVTGEEPTGNAVQPSPQHENFGALTVRETEKKPVVINTEEALKNIEKRIALFPFENLTSEGEVMDRMIPVLSDQLGKKGFTIIDEKIVADFLCDQRVRSSGYVSGELARKIGDEFIVKTILTGAVVSYSTGKDPQFGILARLINVSDGSIIWADYASATGDDFTTVLGLGRLRSMSSLVPRVIERLLKSFNVAISRKEKESAFKIAVMPFQNNTEYRKAGIIATYMFLVELLKYQKFDPIEYGNVRELLIDLRIRTKGQLDYEKISVISKRLNSGGILVGVVNQYSDGKSDSTSPKVSLTARLISSRDSKILWYNSHDLNGEKDIIALDWGRIRAVDRVAYKVVSRLTKELKKAVLH